MNHLRKISTNLLFNHLSTVTLNRSRRPLFGSLRRGYPATYDGDGKTTATILNLEENIGLLINSYSPHGFRLNNKLFVRGSMAIFPNTALSWRVAKIEDATEESLALFHLIEPKLDLVIIGVGDRQYCTRERRAFFSGIMKQHNLQTEILPTDAACSTFNFLVAENRFVGAVLIPPLEGYTLALDSFDRPEPGDHLFS